jgi:hypothetical protein
MIGGARRQSIHTEFAKRRVSRHVSRPDDQCDVCERGREDIVYTARHVVDKCVVSSLKVK